MLALTFQVGDDRVALDTRLVREVVPRVRLRRPAAAPAWLAGMFVHRGRVVPVIDLHRHLDAGECPPHLSSRIILVPAAALADVTAAAGDDEPLVGLLAAQVADVRNLRDEAAPAGPSALPGLGRAVVEGGRILHLLDLRRLLPEDVRRGLIEEKSAPGLVPRGD